MECEQGIGGKNSPIHYIPKKDPVQDALKKNKKTNYVKLTLPNMGKNRVTLWVPRTPKQFKLHAHSTIHACKQMEHDVKFSRDKEAAATAMLTLEIKKTSMCKLTIWRENRQKGTKEKVNLPQSRPKKPPRLQILQSLPL